MVSLVDLLDGAARFNCGHMSTVGAGGKAYDMLAMPVF